MKKSLTAAAVLLSLLCCAPALSLAAEKTAASASPADKSSLAGHYYLNGRTEVGSELLLKADGSFQWGLSYGAVDQFARGTWSLQGNSVTLTSAPQGVPNFKLFDADDYHNTHPAEAGVWIAIVGFPHQGPLANVEVQFESASGRSATAVSVRNGDAIVKMPATEQWKRAGLRMKDSKAPLQWIDMPAERVKARLAGFTVSNPDAITPSAFKTMSLERVGDRLRAGDSSPVGGGEYAKGQ